MRNDELSDVRRTRREIAEECEHDIERILDYYQAAQETLKSSGKFTFVDEPIRSLTPACKTDT